MPQTAVIYIKNRVNRAWYAPDQQTTEATIAEDEKARFRDRVLPLLGASEPLVRQQLIPVLQRILQADFPSRWPRFMDFTTELLNTNDPGSVLAGLQCLLAICRAFRYKAVESQDRVHFDKIIEICFPRTLAICNELVNQESDEAGEMLHLALKAYKHATWVRLLSCIIIVIIICRVWTDAVSPSAGTIPPFAPGAGQHRLVHCPSPDCVQDAASQLHGWRRLRSREAPLVEGQEVGVLQSQPPLYQV